MEHDRQPITPPESAGSAGEKKESRRKRRRRPAHVPLEVIAEDQRRVQEQAERAAHESAEQKEGKRKKRKKRAETAPETAEAKKEEKTEPKSLEEQAEKKPEREPEAKEAEKKAETEPDEAAEASGKTQEKTVAAAETAESTETVEADPSQPADDTELAVIPLDTDELEEEVFVSDRLRRQTKPGEAAEPDTSSTEAEPVADTAETDKSKTEDETTPPPPAPARPMPQAAATTRTAGSQTATPNTPPPPPRPAALGGGNMPPVPPFNPNIYSGGTGGNIMPPVPVVAAANRLPNPNTNVLRDYQERRHNGRAILAGILVGGLIEHIRHKRREKRMEKAHAKEVKELGKEHDATRLRLRETEAKAEESARKKTALERQLERLKGAPARAVEAMPLTAETVASEARSEKTTPTEIAPERKAEVAKELTAAEEAIKKAQAAVEQAHENPDELPELPSDRRVEASAWHRIEIDKKTGKAVEDPTLAYGKEFLHEQHAEQLRKEIEDTSLDGDSIREQYSPFKTLPAHSAVPAGQSSSSHGSASKTSNASRRDQVIGAAKDVMQKVDPVDATLSVVLLLIIWLIIKLA